MIPGRVHSENLCMNASIFLIISGMLFTACKPNESGKIAEVELSSTVPVAWDIEIQDEHIDMLHRSGKSGVNHLAMVRLQFINLPPSEEGNSYTLIGGGLNGTGLHGPNSTGFEGTGYHFADPKSIPGDNPPRDVGYKDDYTRTVRDGALDFVIYYEPSNIHQWGEHYFPGSEVALTLMRSGTGDRVLHASDNEFNWAVAGVGAGNAAEITINMAMAEYTWHMQL